MIDWCISGWRQQSSQRAQILDWLAEAKKLGFERYSLVKQGQHYWLCCCNYADYDLAIYVREQISSNAAVFVQREGNHLICVAWNGDTLLGASQFAADAIGVKSLICIAHRWLAKDGMSCSLIIGGRGSREILAEQIRSDFAVKEVSEIDFGSYSRNSKLRSIRRSPFWLRRQVIVAAIGLILVSSAALSWAYWPTQITPTTIDRYSSPVRIENNKPQWLVTQLRHVNDLLIQVSYLAGWQVQRWQLSENGEQLWLQSSYGGKRDLLSQIPSQSEWLWHQRGNSVYIERALPEPENLKSYDNLAPTDLERLGFILARKNSRVTIKHEALDTTDGTMWQALIDWLMLQPDALQIRSAKAEAAGYFWSFVIELETKKQGAQ